MNSFSLTFFVFLFSAKTELEKTTEEKAQKDEENKVRYIMIIVKIFLLLLLFNLTAQIAK